QGAAPRAHDLPKAIEQGRGVRANNSFQNATWGQVTARNARSVWTIPTQPLPDEHYAAYPEELVRRCVLAGTSERGVCPECGAPWRRVVEREPTGRKWTGQRVDANDGFVKGYEPGVELATVTT